MIKPINISSLDTSNKVYFKCDKCGKEGNLELDNSIINTNNDGNPINNKDVYDCPFCGYNL